jgi:hypothetical protein
MSTTLKVVQSNTAPQYQITCTRDDGSIVVLTNTTVTLNLYKGSNKVNTGHETCTIINAGSGIIGWQPQTGDLATPGSYKGDIVVTYLDATFEILYGQLLLKARKIGG